MPRNSPSRLLLFVLSVSTLASPTVRAAETPAAFVPFNLPTSESTTAPAVLLPTQDGQLFLVYAPSSSAIVTYILVPSVSPQPTPPTPPTPPPNQPRRLILIGEQSPPQLADEIAAYLPQHSYTSSSYSVADLTSGNPTPDALHWIGKSAGKTYPYAFITDSTGTILWQGNLPSTISETLAILANPSAYRSRIIRRCPTGYCPLPHLQPTNCY